MPSLGIGLHEANKTGIFHPLTADLALLEELFAPLAVHTSKQMHSRDNDNIDDK
jgi:hypothetical protein